jgi:hypothetical protein
VLVWVSVPPVRVRVRVRLDVDRAAGWMLEKTLMRPPSGMDRNGREATKTS